MKEKKYRTSTAGLGALFTMLLGALLMVAFVVNFNQGVDKKEDGQKKQTRIVKMQEKRKTVPKKAPQKRVAKARPKTEPDVQPPDLNAMIGGIAMNIPEFNTAALTGDSRELLDDIVKDTVMSEDTVDSKPQITHRTPITYPGDAVKNGIQGYVVVHLLIAKDGSVELSKVLDSEPQGVFETSVLSGIQDWRFTPARLKGEPVKVWVKQKVSFNS